jgi:hypothetical protein
MDDIDGEIFAEGHKVMVPLEPEQRHAWVEPLPNLGFFRRAANV